MIKKIMCAFLITTTMLSFAACADDSNSTEDEKEETKVTENVTKDETDEETEDSVEETEDSTDTTLELTADDLSILFNNGEDTENRVNVQDMTGKTFAELLDSGYDYMGYAGWGDEYTFLVTTENVDATAKDVVKKLEGKTVKELTDKDLSIGYYSFGDSDYTYTTKIGDVEFSFDIEGASEIVDKYNDEDPFADVEDMEELYDKKISNVEFVSITYTLKFDDSFDVDNFKNGDDFELDNPEEQLKDCVVAEIYYNSIPADFLQ